VGAGTLRGKAMRLRRRLRLLEKAMPARQEPAAADDTVDWEAVCQALLSDGAGEGLDLPSLEALARLRPYAEVFRSFCETADGPEGATVSPEAAGGC
jgi:hypothetical protein